MHDERPKRVYVDDKDEESMMPTKENGIYAWKPQSTIVKNQPTKLPTTST